MLKARRLTPTEDAAIAVLIVNAEVERLGELAAIPRIRIIPNLEGNFCRIFRRKLSAIEILRRAQQRAADRFAKEAEGIYH